MSAPPAGAHAAARPRRLPAGRAGKNWSSAALAGVLTLAYLVLCGIYILVSSALASRVSDDTAEMYSIEVLKGLLFVLATGAVFYAFARTALGRLARAHEELERQSLRLLEAERQRVTAFMARSVGHDLNNILQVMFGRVDLQEMLADEAPSARPFHAEMRKGLAELAQLVARLNVSAQAGEPGARTATDLVAQAQQALTFAVVHPDLQGVRTRLTGETGLEARVQVSALQQALLNLLLNAGRAVRGRGSIEVRVLRTAGHGVIEVHDDGPGVPAEIRSRLFREPVSRFPDGHGLGLLSVAACVEELRGEVTCHASELGGACFRITLPLDEDGDDSTTR